MVEASKIPGRRRFQVVISSLHKATSCVRKQATAGIIVGGKQIRLHCRGAREGEGYGMEI